MNSKDENKNTKKNNIKLIKGIKTELGISNKNTKLYQNAFNPNIFMPQVTNLFPDHKRIFKNLKLGLGETFSNTIKDTFSTPLLGISNLQKDFISLINEKFNFPIFKDISLALDNIKANPDSVLSWEIYYDKLSEFFWIFPYKMTTKDLHELLQNVLTEDDFDSYMEKYFNEEKINELTNDIKSLLSKDEVKNFFDQIMFSYNNKCYALANVGLTSIIDNALSFYLFNKKINKRRDIFKPIIDDLNSKSTDSHLVFIVMMISSNINLLYENFDFNNTIDINTTKKARRHPFAHGKFYSNKKTDTLMLLNTLYYLLLIQQELKEYENSIKIQNKFFCIEKQIKD